MKREYGYESQPKIQFSELLRERKIKFEKDQRVLNRLLKNKLSKNNIKIINPQRFPQQTLEKQASKDKQPFKQYHLQEENSYETIQQPHGSPKINDIRREYQLQQKAQSFIQRLRKQKEYNQGRLLFLRKKEEERKEQERIKMETINKQILQSYNRKKIKQIMSNIMLHEQRISFRADESMAKEMRKSNIRSKTENAVRSQSVRESFQINRNQLPKLSWQKRKIMNISSVID